MIKVPNPNQEPPASSKAPNKDIEDMDVICIFSHFLDDSCHSGAGGSWLWFGILILILIWSLVFDTPMIQILSNFILKVQRTSMSFKSWFGALEDAAGSWLVFVILIMIWIWSVVFGTLMFQNLALSWFWRCKEHACHLSPDMGIWRMLKAPD